MHGAHTAVELRVQRAPRMNVPLVQAPSSRHGAVTYGCEPPHSVAMYTVTPTLAPSMHCFRTQPWIASERSRYIPAGGGLCTMSYWQYAQ